jgi:hypothetical protein
MKINKYVGATLASVAMMSSFVAVPVFAETAAINVNTNLNDTEVNASANMMMRGRGLGNGEGVRMKLPGVFGKVTAVSGNTITVIGSAGVRGDTVATTYTVDATNAKVTKANTASTVSSIVVGDIVAVRGTVSGTNIIATAVYDGLTTKGRMGMDQEKNGDRRDEMNFPITGNGQPVVAGTISSVSGTSVTITNKSNVSYVADITSAKIVQGKTIVTASNLKVGDRVVIQGAVAGNSIVATSVIDGSAQASTNEEGGINSKSRGFFGSIGHFFLSIFGF